MALDDLIGLAGMFKDARKIPEQARAAVAEFAESVGLETFPMIHAVVKKGPDGWELVAVSLDPALLPAPEPAHFVLCARLDMGKPAKKEG